MSIKRSAAGEIRTLIESLSSAEEIKRESAIARLAIIGERAVDGLVRAYPAADRDTRIAILRTAEPIMDPRMLPPAIEALGATGDLALAGAASLRAMLDSPAESAASQALDALVATALDRGADRHVRLAAFDALRDMPATVREPVARALQQDPDAGVQARAVDGPREAAVEEAVWRDALDGRLSEDPASLRDAVKARGGSAPLNDLQKLVEAVRIREAEATGTRREAWRRVRGSLHQALALRGSRVAVYDLRETVERARAALPTPFMTALHVVGDESCLEPIATAWAASTDAGWKHQLEAAFAAIVKREKLTRRSAVIKKISARWPELT
jgi:hypothetical protein